MSLTGISTIYICWCYLENGYKKAKFKSCSSNVCYSDHVWHEGRCGGWARQWFPDGGAPLVVD